MPEQERSIELSDARDGSPEISPELLADYVRTIYVGCYREFTGKMSYGQERMNTWDGGEDNFGKRHQAIWPRIATAILRQNSDPVGFIRAQFWCRRNDSRPPAPSYLLSQEATARYGAYLQQAPLAARREYEMGMRTIQGEVLLLTTGPGWEYLEALRYVLRSTVTVRVPTLIRYCLAANNGLTGLAAYFHDQALLQYVFQQEIIDEAWGIHIPAALRAESIQLRSRLLGRH